MHKKLMHGKTCTIKHDQKGIFKGVRNPFNATRYHSLAGERKSIPECLQITAESVEDGEIMGIRHVKYPIYGVQFHPESILCEDGKLIIKELLGGQTVMIREGIQKLIEGTDLTFEESGEIMREVISGKVNKRSNCSFPNSSTNER